MIQTLYLIRYFVDLPLISCNNYTYLSVYMATEKNGGLFGYEEEYCGDDILRDSVSADVKLYDCIIHASGFGPFDEDRKTASVKICSYG